MLLCLYFVTLHFAFHDKFGGINSILFYSNLQCNSLHKGLVLAKFFKNVEKPRERFLLSISSSIRINFWQCVGKFENILECGQLSTPKTLITMKDFKLHLLDDMQ